ncbi:MAG: diacylglycerol kinase [Sphaerotilus natans subsp. sulfidivorans]|uniref:diacylglycerol/lipid kinase family protein n=1 Tax=Sphaerotilus sulfidivorans TaxID=639200 RepID=UPI002357616B|nr:diacylglycerol kinase family protein [Sphaerotilus sulfidivorans]MCK6402339.1 diacylglycerol kinase [Sphaerotilus sulfidivorans]
MTAPPPIDRAHAPLHMIVNAHAGHRHDRQDLDALLSRHLPAGSRPWVLYRPRRPAELPALAARVVARARSDGGVIVAAGGDGTLNTVVQALWEHQIPFGALPRGTFNFFGRQHGLPTDTDEALTHLLAAIEAGDMRPVQLGRIGGRIFLVNASLGLYPELLEEREAMKRRHGRSQWIARLAGLVSLMRPRRSWRLHLTRTDLDGQRHREQREASTLFIGNNPLQLREVGLSDAALHQGGLGALTLAPVGRAGMLGLILQGLIGRLGRAQAVQDFAFSRLDIDLPGRRRMRIAIDGERIRLPLPLRVEVAPRPLWLLGARDTAEPA